LYCPLQDPQNNTLLEGGFAAFQLNRYETATNIFFALIKRDSLFCDGYFFLGYALRRQNRYKDAFVFYYKADKMVQNKSEEYKLNLASVALTLGLDSFARLKYEEMVKYFPTNPEGYYGVALTAPSLGDYENGLVHINKAIDKYNGYSERENSDPYFIKGILLALTSKYEEGKECLEKAPKRLRKQEHFNIFYSLCLLKIGIANQDDKLKKKAKKYYKKIQFKNEIQKEVKDILVFE